MCYKRSKPRVQLKKLRRFLNKNRMRICLESCINAPECQYCQLIYQINYSYICNKLATVKKFRSSILGPTFLMLEDIYTEHKKEGNGKTMVILLKNLSLKSKKRLFVEFRF